MLDAAVWQAGRHGMAGQLIDPLAGVLLPAEAVLTQLLRHIRPALEEAGVMQDVLPLLIPMAGRLLHAPDESLTFVPYGQREHEVIHSVSRPGLNRLLLDAAMAEPALVRLVGGRLGERGRVGSERNIGPCDERLAIGERGILASVDEQRR